MGLVVIAGAGTMLVTVLLVAWPTFHTAAGSGLRPPISAQEHASVDDAFGAAGLLALSVGVTVALAVALVVTWLVARRLAAPVAEAGDAHAGSPTATTRPAFHSRASAPSSTP